MSLPQRATPHPFEREVASSERAPTLRNTRPENVIRVALVDDEVLVRAGLARVLADHQPIAVVADGPVSDAARIVSECRPHVLVVIARDPEPVTADAVRAASVASPETAVLLLSPDHDTRGSRRALGLGVRGVVGLAQPVATLLKAIKKVHEGELWLDRATTAGLLRDGDRQDPEQAKVESLTRREFEIVTLVAEGLRNHQIAERLSISHATVRNHVTSILDKLDLVDCFDLAVYAFRHGLVR